MLDATKPLETRDLLRTRHRQRGALSNVSDFVMSRTLSFREYNRDGLKITRAAGNEREKVSTERVLRQWADSIAEKPEIAELLERMEVEVAAGSVRRCLARNDLGSGLWARIEADTEQAAEERVNDLNDLDAETRASLFDFVRLLIFADALANDYEDPRVAEVLKEAARASA